MPGTLFHVGATAICPHGGQVTVVPTAPRVMIDSMVVATKADLFPIAGCAFAPGGAAHPCITAQFSVGATRVKINGQDAIIMGSVGLCKAGDEAPQGPPSILVTQVRVTGT